MRNRKNERHDAEKQTCEKENVISSVRLKMANKCDKEDLDEEIKVLLIEQKEKERPRIRSSEKERVRESKRE